MALCISTTLIGCGGNGGDNSDETVPPISEPDPASGPFSIASYTEYKEGRDLSGLWIMVIDAEYNTTDEKGFVIGPAHEYARGTVFIKENGPGGGIEVSNPFCKANMAGDVQASYNGNNVAISYGGNDFDLTVNDYSRMGGNLVIYVGTNCTLGDICADPSDIVASVQMVKVAPLPPGNWVDNFADAAPAIGTIRGFAQPRIGYNGLELDHEVNCFMHSKGTGGHRLSGSVAGILGPDYETIAVTSNTDEHLWFNKSQMLSFESIGYDPLSSYYAVLFAHATRNFDMSIDGINPVTIEISARSDASADATSDEAAFDIEIAF